MKKRYADRIRFEVGVQPLQGVLDPASFEQYAEACELADYCGGLPSRDRPKPEKHLDVILQLAKKLGKPVDVHIDQENNPLENETELLAEKTIEHGMQGRVFGVHAISLSAKEDREQDRIIEKVKEADMGIIICPSAALSMKQLPMTAPLHNSIAPYVKLREAGVRMLPRRRQRARPLHADGRRRHLDRVPDADGSDAASMTSTPSRNGPAPSRSRSRRSLPRQALPTRKRHSSGRDTVPLKRAAGGRRRS